MDTTPYMLNPGGEHVEPIKNMAALIHQRLLNASKESTRTFNELLQHYAIERFLFRRSKSEYVDRLVLSPELNG